MTRDELTEMSDRDLQATLDGYLILQEEGATNRRDAATIRRLAAEAKGRAGDIAYWDARHDATLDRTRQANLR
ncbi:hypothetical protein ACFWYW_58950 [Nonomuraea sp. NPDC059023]|uniref:hypothetical protein n=1 Tax=unclassified Nonomuraea TaxID=2593643 RepID=UPI0036B6EDAB